MTNLRPTYKPIDSSLHAYLNGLEQSDGSVVFDANLGVYVFKEAVTGDRLELRYAYDPNDAVLPPAIFVTYGYHGFNGDRQYTSPSVALNAMDEGPAFMRIDSNSGAGRDATDFNAWNGIIGCYDSAGDFGSILVDHGGEGVHLEVIEKFTNRPGDNIPSGFQSFTVFNQPNIFSGDRYQILLGGTEMKLEKGVTINGSFTTRTLATVTLGWNSTVGHYNDGRGSQKNKLVIHHDGNGFITAELTGLEHQVAGETSPFTVQNVSNTGFARLTFQDDGVTNGPILRGGYSGVTGLSSGDGRFIDDFRIESFLRSP